MILDLSIFEHPVLDEEINTITLNRRGGATTGSQRGLQSLRVVQAAWQNTKILKKAKHLVSNLKFDFGKDHHVEDIVNEIEKSLEILTEICLCHSKTTSASVFYQVIAINILLEGGNGKKVFIQLEDHLFNLNDFILCRVDVGPLR